MDRVKSRFVWKLKVQEQRDRASGCVVAAEMRFAKWADGQPDWSKGDTDCCSKDNVGCCESCLNLWPQRRYKWNDVSCYNKYCFVCERT